MKFFSKYLLLLLALLVGCKEDHFSPREIGLRYYPVQKGMTWTYHVDETVYSEVKAPEELHYQLRVEVADSSQNPDGTYSYILYRYTRDSESDAWTSLDTWTARKNDRELVVTEGTTSYLKLVFPLRKGNSWDGNLYNDNGADDYRLDILNAPYEISGTTFEHSLTVEQENNDDFIVFLDQRKEVYAEDVGLIYSETTQLEYCTAENCIGQQKIQSGLVRKQSLIDYAN